MAKGKIKTVRFDAVEARMMAAIVRKYRKEREGDATAPTATDSEVMQRALRAYFDNEFPELAERRTAAIAELAEEVSGERFPRDAKGIKALADRAIQVGMTVEMEFLDEVEGGAATS